MKRVDIALGVLVLAVVAISIDQCTRATSKPLPTMACQHVRPDGAGLTWKRCGNEEILCWIEPGGEAICKWLK